MMKILTLPSALLVILSGILLGLTAPGNHTQWLGFIALLPILIVFDRIHKTDLSPGKRLGYFLLASWVVGIISAPLGVPWMTHAIVTFAELPWPVAIAITSLAYGLEVGYLVFVCLALPLLFIKKLGQWDILVRLSWFLAIETFLPQFFRWSFAGMTLFDEPLLAQSADLIGSPRLGIYTLGLSFLLLLLWRYKITEQHVRQTFIRSLVSAYVVVLVAGVSYGIWRADTIAQQAQEGSGLDVIALQPNFSIEPKTDANGTVYLDRHRGVDTLIAESNKALQQYPARNETPRLVVWPESTLPVRFMRRANDINKVINFVRDQQVYLLLATIGWQQQPSGLRPQGVALLFGPNGKLVGRYNKIFLIPFGEYIPGAERFPVIGDVVRKIAPRSSDFLAGTEYTVFELDSNRAFSASICFDVFATDILRNMARGGTSMIFNLANLAWFGDTTATDHMAMAIRWQSIENRTPVYEVSNNGETFLIDATGRRNGEVLPLYSSGVSNKNLTLTSHYSFYRENTGLVDSVFVLLFFVTAWWAQRCEQLFTGK